MCKVCRCSPEEHDIQTTDKEHVRRIGNLFDADEHSKTKYRIQKLTVKRTPQINAPSPSKSAPGKENNDKGTSPSSEQSEVTFEWVPQGADEDTVSQAFRPLN